MRVHHIALRTADLDRLEAFYCDVVGLMASPDERMENPRSRWLWADTTCVMIERMDPGEPPIPDGSMDLIAFSIAPDERARFEARLSRMDVFIEHRTDFTLYFRDPDGRRVAVSHYPDRAEAPSRPLPQPMQRPT